MEALDLVVLVADRDALFTVNTLLQKRAPALGIRKIRFESIKHDQRDPGVWNDAVGLLRAYLRRVKHALVLFDREGSGQEQHGAAQLETRLEDRLKQSGWEHARVVALDPELEVWVWSRSPHVAQTLGLTQEQLNTVLAGFAGDEHGKPERPKEALDAALRRAKKPHSASIFQQLAEKVSLTGDERAFKRLRETLQGWFPAAKV
jgi:hypothetical protein